MASIIAALAISGSRKPDGSPNAGGTVYLSLISSPNSSVVAYADRDKNAAVTLTNGGYVLDQAGKAALFVDTACRVRTLDSSGVPVDSFTFEPSTNAGLVEVLNAGFTGVSPTSGALVGGGRTTLDAVLTSLAGSLGGTDGLFTVGGVGASLRGVQTKFSEVQVSVKDFGAVGNGAADDTNAIQLAVNKVIANGGGVVYLPPGTYPISAAIVVNGAVSISFRGAGIGASIVKQNNGAANTLTVGSLMTGLSIEDCAFSAAASTGTAVAIAAASAIVAYKFVNFKASGHASCITGVSPATLGASAVLLNVIGDTTVASVGSVLSGSLEGTTIIGGTFNGNIQSTTCTNILFTAAVGTGALGCTIVGLTNYHNSTYAMDIPANAVSTIIVLGGRASGTVRINAGCTSSIQMVGGTNFSQVQDARTGLPVATSLAGNGSVTPTPNGSIRIIQATAASTVTINGLGVNLLANTFVEFVCANNSGGAVTWTFSGNYRTSGAVAPATGSAVVIRFIWDHLTQIFREEYRTTVTI
jgi:hypothetical protein